MSGYVKGDWLAIVSLAAIVACVAIPIYTEVKDHGVTSGTVVYRKFEPGHLWLMKPVRWIPDAWSIGVEGNTPSGEVRTRYVDVSQDTYDDTPLGKSVRVDKLKLSH